LTGRLSHGLGDTHVPAGKEGNRDLAAAPGLPLIADGDGQTSLTSIRRSYVLSQRNLSVTPTIIRPFNKVRYLPHLENCQYTTLYNCCKYCTYNPVRAKLTCQRLALFRKANTVMPRAIPRLFSRAPSCCELRMTRRQTRDNSKGNRNRWFYSCGECGHMVFDDWEGIREGNPLCECGEISRGQKERGRAYVFRCARGECEYRSEDDEDEEDEEDD
jgi:hypothetical protein